VLFGSYYPFFYFESALLKLQESDLDEASRRAIREHNARQLIAPAVRASLYWTKDRTKTAKL